MHIVIQQNKKNKYNNKNKKMFFNNLNLCKKIFTKT